METSPYSADGIEVIYRPSAPNACAKNYQSPDRRSYVLPAGYQHTPGAMRLSCDIQIDQDVAIELEDGVTILVDVYRPTGNGRHPAIMGWGPYGKRGSWLTNDLFGHPTRMDVPVSWEDGLNAFEGPNPAYWVSHGYAIVSPDPRGVFNSDGDIRAWGSAEGRDEYNVIEWIAHQTWCTGKVGLTGNSWLAMSQWFVAALRPPHLAAIAPWEGAQDIYRDTMARGGIPDVMFSEGIFSGLNGNNRTENPVAMLETHPLFNEYWASKVADVENISVPAYVVASWTNQLHTNGTFTAWRKLQSKHKWLRVHNTHEWTDYYTPENVDDLRRFFDRYLKQLDNGWESTPPVRLSILNPGGRDTLNRSETTFPLERQRVDTFHLGWDGHSGTLSQTPFSQEASCTYDHTNPQGVCFRITFNQDIEITGYIKLKLWVQALDHDDMDLFAYLRKVDRNGFYAEPTVVTNRKHIGPNGRLRVSQRHQDLDRSSELEPYYTFDRSLRLSADMIVPIEIGFWPYGMRWLAGETLELCVNGADLLKRPEFPTLPPVRTINRGRHVIHVGGKYDSTLSMPIIPF